MSEVNTNSTANTENKQNEKSFFKKSRKCMFSEKGSPKIDYKNPELLKRFVSEGGRMLPSRITNVSAKKQRELKKAIKHSRVLALMPFVHTGK